jgi:hypothetical protein
LSETLTAASTVHSTTDGSRGPYGPYLAVIDGGPYRALYE